MEEGAHTILHFSFKVLDFLLLMIHVSIEGRRTLNMNKLTNIIATLSILSLVACSGSDGNFSPIDNVGGQNTGTGNDGTGNDGTGNTGNGGSIGTGNVGGDDGTGGVGAGNIGNGGTTCVPKTCEQIGRDIANSLSTVEEPFDPGVVELYNATACGVVDDGCGSPINCGDVCVLGADCGGDFAIDFTPGGFPYIGEHRFVSSPNLCGTGCIYNETSEGYIDEVAAPFPYTGYVSSISCPSSFNLDVLFSDPPPQTIEMMRECRFQYSADECHEFSQTINRSGDSMYRNGAIFYNLPMI